MYAYNIKYKEKQRIFLIFLKHSTTLDSKINAKFKLYFYFFKI